MGGSYYDRDVGSTYTSPGFSSHAAYTSAADSAMSRTGLNRSLIPLGRDLFCPNGDPVVIAIDVTGSMGIASKIIYDKMPMLCGQIHMQGYLKDPAISFAAVGDSFSDRAPIQVCDFATGKQLDSWLTQLWLEGGGGGSSQESYTLAAYAYLRLARFESTANKPYFFFIGDEGFYDYLESDEINRYVGKGKRISSVSVLEELLDVYHVFLIHLLYKNNPSADSRIVNQWASILGDERVIPLQDPKAVVDTILGAIALQSGARDLDGYRDDLISRGQSEKRIQEVTSGLKSLSTSTSLVPATTTGLLPPPSGNKRDGGSKRL